MTPQEARALLAAQRRRTLARLAGVERELAAIVEQVRAETPDDEHDPDGATTGFERAQATRLRDDAIARLAALDDAGARIEDGTWARCTACGGRVADERLRARPVAATCIDCANG